MLKTYSIIYKIIGTIFCIVAPGVFFGIVADRVPIKNGIFIFLIFLATGILFFIIGRDLKKLKTRVLFTLTPVAGLLTILFCFLAVKSYQVSEFVSLLIQGLLALFFASSAIFVHSDKVKSKLS